MGLRSWTAVLDPLKDHAAGLARGRWQLADTWMPFPEEHLPIGEGVGRLVTVRVESPWRAFFFDRHSLVGRGPGRLVLLADVAGEVRLEAGYLRVTVYGSALAVVVVAAMSAVFIVGGIHFFLRGPAFGTAIAGSVPVAMGGWLLRQLRKAGREVAEDAAHILGLMARGENAPAALAPERRCSAQ